MASRPSKSCSNKFPPTTGSRENSTYRNRILSESELKRHLMGVLAISERGLKNVPADLRDVVIAAGKAGGEAGRKYVWDSNDVFIEKIRNAGLTVVDDIDVLPFIAKLAPLHDELAKEFGAEELLRIIREEADVARM